MTSLGAETIPPAKVIDPSSICNLLVVVAMDVERDALLKNHTVESITFGGNLKVRVDQFKHGSRNITVFRSGVGGVNAAVGLAMIYNHLLIDAVILLGVGGALSHELLIGDAVISTAVVQHDSIYSGENGDLLMAPGYLFHSMPEGQRASPTMVSSPELVKWLLQKWPGTRAGLIISGGEFVGSAKRKLALCKAHPGALLVDMEAAALAQICRHSGLPFVAAKTVADRLLPNFTVASDYKTYLTEAAVRAGSLLQCLFET